MGDIPNTNDMNNSNLNQVISDLVLTKFDSVIESINVLESFTSEDFIHEVRENYQLLDDTPINIEELKTHIEKNIVPQLDLLKNFMRDVIWAFDVILRLEEESES